MKTNHVAWIFVISFVLVFSIIIIWYAPDKAYILIPGYFAALISVLASKGMKLDERKDERLIHLATLGARNAFFVLLLFLPVLATFSLLGILTFGAPEILIILWITIILIEYISIAYYYWK